MEDVINNMYYLQIDDLKSFLIKYRENSICSVPIFREYKNAPMEQSAKFSNLHKFESWKNKIYFKQQGETLLTLCGKGDERKVEQLLIEFSGLIDFKNDKGWTPLIVAVFNQQIEIVKILLSFGADPNATNLKGTTVLMYAKTNLMNQKKPNLELLNILIGAGSKVLSKDQFGKSVLDYCEGNDVIYSFLKEKAADEVL